MASSNKSLPGYVTVLVRILWLKCFNKSSVKSCFINWTNYFLFIFMRTPSVSLCSPSPRSNSPVTYTTCNSYSWLWARHCDSCEMNEGAGRRTCVQCPSKVAHCWPGYAKADVSVGKNLSVMLLEVLRNTEKSVFNRIWAQSIVLYNLFSIVSICTKIHLLLQKTETQ
jgi:hypothetical protein